MGRMCYICQRKASKSDQVSLHVIPKEPIARHKWMKICNLLPSDDLKYIYICSMHFSDNHIDRGNQFQTRCTLKTGAVPLVGVPNQMSFHKENIDNLNVGTGTENNMETIKVEMAETCDSIHESDGIVQNVDPLDNIIDNASVQELLSPIYPKAVYLPSLIYPSEEVLFEQCDNFIKGRSLDTADVSLEGEVEENFGKSNESYCSMPNRKFHEPRYVSEIGISDFKTPEITRRVLNLISDTDKRKSKVIKSLRDRNRKLENRISSLKQIVANLKKKNMVSNGSGNILLVIANNKINH